MTGLLLEVSIRSAMTLLKQQSSRYCSSTRHGVCPSIPHKFEYCEFQFALEWLLQFDGRNDQSFLIIDDVCVDVNGGACGLVATTPEPSTGLLSGLSLLGLSLLLPRIKRSRNGGVAKSTSTIVTPSMRTAWSYTLRECLGMITSLDIPARLGTRCIFSGFAPAMQAAVAWVSAAAHPADTRLFFCIVPSPLIYAL